MKLTNGFDIRSSALTAQRLRMDIISSNIANADTTRGQLVNGKWVPYQRKLVNMEAVGQTSFSDIFNSKIGDSAGQGVKITRIFGDETPFKNVYNPNHPDADVNGFVLMPNVDILKEMADMISATRSYEANVTTLNATKAMYMKTLEIGQ